MPGACGSSNGGAEALIPSFLAELRADCEAEYGFIGDQNRGQQASAVCFCRFRYRHQSADRIAGMTARTGIVVIEVPAHKTAHKGSRFSGCALWIAQDPSLPARGQRALRKAHCNLDRL